MQKFMRYWGDCREEFEALVAVIKQEKALESFDFSSIGIILSFVAFL